MPSINRVEAMGHLGRDPEVKYLPSGDPVANFTVATSERFKGRDGSNKESTEWINVVVFGKQAESCGNYLKKGSLVFVEGRLTTRSWEKNGQKQYRTEVNAQRVHFLDGKGGAADRQRAEPQQQPSADDSDLPF